MTFGPALPELLLLLLLLLLLGLLLLGPVAIAAGSRTGGNTGRGGGAVSGSRRCLRNLPLPPPPRPLPRPLLLPPPPRPPPPRPPPPRPPPPRPPPRPLPPPLVLLMSHQLTRLLQRGTCRCGSSALTEGPRRREINRSAIRDAIDHRIGQKKVEQLLAAAASSQPCRQRSATHRERRERETVPSVTMYTSSCASPASLGILRRGGSPRAFTGVQPPPATSTGKQP